MELEEILGAIETYWEQEEIISAKRYRQLEEMLGARRDTED